MLCLHNSLNHNHNFSPFNRLNCIRFFVTDYNSTTLAISRSTLFSVINRRGGKKRFQHFQFFNEGMVAGIDVCGTLIVSPPFLFQTLKKVRFIKNMGYDLCMYKFTR